MEENKKIGFNKAMMVVVVAIMILNLAFTCFLFGKQLENSKSIQHIDKQIEQTTENKETKYYLYIGTSDKDTGEQKYPMEQCRKIVTDICEKYTTGCTLLEATGYWKDESGEAGTEHTIECVLEDISKDKVHQIAKDCIKELNQSTILIETDQVESEFYTGQ